MSDLIDLEIESLDASGSGLGRHGRHTVFVPFTIPGERVRVRITHTPRGHAGTLVDVLRASPHRIVPRCPHFGPCGGCAWQHIAYPEQLRLKSSIVERLVKSAVRQAPATLPTLPGASASDPWGYRHKVHFVFGPVESARRGAPHRRRPALAMGHYARGSRKIVPVHECPVHDERGNAVAFRLLAEYERAEIAPAASSRFNGRGGDTDRGVLKSITVRVGSATGELMTTLVVSAETDKRLRSATRRVVQEGTHATALHVNVHPRDNAFIFGRETRRISGPERLRDEVAGTSFLISPTAFFQTTVRAAETLVRLVMDAVPAGATVLDLYAGAGLFALPLASRGHAVVAVEENRSAVADGEASARVNRIPPERCRFIARPVELALPSLRPADAIVLDPPREGCTPGVLEAAFGRLRPRRAVYVSCNPEALARDLTDITSLGYTIESIQPVDMFPHTAHIETVVTITLP